MRLYNYKEYKKRLLHFVKDAFLLHMKLWLNAVRTSK